MDDIFPYVRALFLGRAADVRWPTQFHRDHELKEAIEQVAVEKLEPFNIADLINYREFADHLFDEFEEGGVIRRERQEFAGDYFFIKQASYNASREKFLGSDSIATTAKRIGPRYYPDVFEGYRRQVASELHEEPSGHSLPVPPTMLEAVDWAQRSAALTPTHVEEIRERAKELLAAINQADLDERTRKNALAHAEAVIDLLEAPDPPWEEIVQLLNNPVLCAILNAAAIMQLILGSFAA